MDTTERVSKFQEGLKKLTEETKITFKPQISPDGPINVFIDLEPNENKTDK